MSHSANFADLDGGKFGAMVATGVLRNSFNRIGSGRGVSWVGVFVKKKRRKTHIRLKITADNPHPRDTKKTDKNVQLKLKTKVVIRAAARPVTTPIAKIQ